MNSAQLINQTSGDVEYYTPPEIIEAARRTMGHIELDPASSFEANKRVRAERFFTELDNGLEQSWNALSVWLNHPFGRISNPAWIEKLESANAAKSFDQLCCITFAATSEKWFRPLLARPQCFLHGRTNYYLPNGSLKRGVTKGSVVTYYGNRLSNFVQEFAPLGTVKIALR